MTTIKEELEELNIYINDLQKGINEILIIDQIDSLDEFKNIYQNIKSELYIINDEDIYDDLDDFIEQENIKSIEDIRKFLKEYWIWKQEISIELNDSFTEDIKTYTQIRYGHFLFVQVDLESDFNEVDKQIYSYMENIWLKNFQAFVNILESLVYIYKVKNIKEVNSEILNKFQKTFSKKPTLKNIKSIYKGQIDSSYSILIDLYEDETLQNIVEEKIINFLIKNEINNNTDFDGYLSDLDSIFEEIQEERCEYKDDYEGKDDGKIRIRIETDQLKPLIKYYVPDFDTELDYSENELFNIIFENKIGYQIIIDFQQRQG